MVKLKHTDALLDLRNTLNLDKPGKNIEVVISVDSTCCILKGSKPVAAAFKEQIEKAGLGPGVDVRFSGCLGFCEIEPMMIIHPLNVLYHRVKESDVDEIINKTIKHGEIIDRLLLEDHQTGQKIKEINEIPFYKKQVRTLLSQNEKIEPANIEDYIAIGGYCSLAKVLATMLPDEVIDLIKDSGLRGRGGGGFLTGRKWASCRKAASEDGARYVICNADEGDPGAYMDRAVLEGNPHSVLEGMLIAAYAVGAGEGYVYVRAEYPLALAHLNLAIEKATAYGLLGEDILGTGMNFVIKVVKGAGAFVCGESTALMASLEGKVGRPRAKYVHTVERGLWNKPSSLNNVETLANVPRIIEKGVDWYKSIGTERSKGTKIFSLVGKITNTGLVEVPMGISMKEIIFDIGGGIPKGKKLKAVQTGGPSGGCLPENLLDLPVDFDELSKAGSMMGSGGMIVMDEDTCMVDVARYFLHFLKGESCGKCVACREGVRRMLEVVEGICAGEGRMEDLDTLYELGEYLKDTSLCALGSSAANPVLSTLKYFKQEYEIHIKDKHCPAGVCKKLFKFNILSGHCTGCGLCRKKCPVNAISGKKKTVHVINTEKCIKCGLCYDVCRFNAVDKVPVNEVVL